MIIIKERIRLDEQQGQLYDQDHRNLLNTDGLSASQDEQTRANEENRRA